MPHPARRRLAQALLWITPAMWSSNFIIARASAGVISPHELATGRWLLALAILLAMSGPALVAQWPHWRREAPQMLVLGALGMWVCGAFVYIGGQTTSALNIGLIYAASPVGIAVAGRLLLREATSTGQRLAMALALAGVLFVIAKGDPASLLAVQFSVGDAWIVVAALCWVVYTVQLQRWPSALAPLPRLACITAGGLLVLLPATLLEPALAPALGLLPSAPLGAHALALVVLAGVLPGVLSYQAYAVMVRELGVTKSSLVMYLSPLYAAFTAWWLLGETPQWYHAVGAGLILPSIHFATRSPSAVRHAPATRPATTPGRHAAGTGAEGP